MEWWISGLMGVGRFTQGGGLGGLARGWYIAAPLGRRTAQPPGEPLPGTADRGSPSWLGKSGAKSACLVYDPQYNGRYTIIRARLFLMTTCHYRSASGLSSFHLWSARLLALAAVASALLMESAQAFSLLGPYADWMDFEKGYRQPGDIGGPMNIGEGYRWNMPVVTYGFDRSFIDYFGSNGVAAVEEAVAILNQVPPAATIDLQSLPLGARRNNLQAESLYLWDLRTFALGRLLEEMGLADSVRYTWCIRDFYINGPNIMFDTEFFVIRRNFDPVTATPSSYVNDALYTYLIPEYPPLSPTNVFCWAQPVPVDQTGGGGDPVTSLFASLGWYYSPYGEYVTNLTRDDIGGLKYLLSAGQLRWESLLPDVHLADTNSGSLVCAAIRPGIEKLTLVRHPTGTVGGQFRPFTNLWTDIYLDFDGPAYQQVERVTTSPDILFTAADLGPLATVTGTDTTNWVNNADLNGNYGGAGPGVIQPPIRITFNSGGPYFFNYGLVDTNAFLTETSQMPLLTWGSFNGATNAPIIYPEGQAGFQPSQVHLRLLLGGAGRDFFWSLPSPAYGRFLLQTATNLADWGTISVMTNLGGRFDYQYQAATNEPARFFRTIRQ
jgi:hypothetical protein